MPVECKGRIVDFVRRQLSLLDRLEYNTVEVWPEGEIITMRESLFTFEFPDDGQQHTLTIALTQSEEYAVTVYFQDDSTGMTSDSLTPQFTKTYGSGDRKTVRIVAEEDATWEPGYSSGGDEYNFLGLVFGSEDDSLKKAVFRHGVRLDGVRHFAGCVGLEDVDFSSSDMTVIGGQSFNNCSSLRQIVWGSSIKTISMSAFEYCSALTKVHVPATVDEIYMLAFAHCGLTRIEVAAKTVYSAAFAYNNDVEYIWVRNTVETLQGIDNLLFGVQWQGCNPDAAFYCEADGKPAGWGSVFDAYGHRTDVVQSDPSYYLRYNAVWGQSTMPWDELAITITSMPDNTYYIVGDTLDLTGLEVVATFPDDVPRDVTRWCIFSPDDGDTLNTEGSLSVEVSYTYKGVTVSTRFNVSVYAQNPPEQSDLNYAYDSDTMALWLSEAVSGTISGYSFNENNSTITIGAPE